MNPPVSVEITQAEALSPEQIALWRRWRDGEPRLASPYFHWRYAQIASRVCPGAAVAVFRRGGEVVGFFPHQRRGRAVQPLGAPMNDYHGVISAPGVDISLEEVAQLLNASRLTVTAWVGEGQAGGERQTVMVRLPESGYVDWYAERRRTFGKYFKDKERARRSLLAELGPIEVRHEVRDAALLDRLIDLKSAQYRRSGLHDIFACDWTRRLLHALMASDDPDFGASIATMHAGGELTALEFSLHAGDQYHFWFPVYEPSLARCSPGILLSMDTMERASADGFRVFDFGFEGEHYKKYFCNDRQTVREAVVLKPGVQATVSDAAADLLNRAGGGRGDALRTSIRRRWAAIEACETTPLARARGAAVAARAAANKALARRKTPHRVAHA